jgi:hypothetical protein
MSTVTDIDRLHAAEKEAQDIVAQAREEARRTRSETEARVTELTEGAGEKLAAMRERVQGEEQGEADAFVKASRERVDAMAAEIAEKLASCKTDAVRTVVEALVTL